MEQITLTRFFITGDKHREFNEIISFCEQNNTTILDTMIILGDSGINYSGGKDDEKLKKQLSKLNITLLCIHGNRENRPNNINTYYLRDFCKGIVLYEEKYPNLLFAVDGEIYNFNGKNAIVIGGAFSQDKVKLINNGELWWDDEEPCEKTKHIVKEKLSLLNNNIDFVMTHTIPYKYKNKIILNDIKDIPGNQTEKWLDSIETGLKYKQWYAGHFHIDMNIGKLCILYKKIKEINC